MSNQQNPKMHTAAYWHYRAEETRVMAEQLVWADTREMMLGVAADYERLAEAAARRDRHQDIMGKEW